MKKEDAIGFILEKDEREKFLRWAKANDLKWMNGEELKETDDCFFHMAVNADKTIANIAALCWVKDKKRPARRMVFKDFLKNN